MSDASLHKLHASPPKLCMSTCLLICLRVFWYVYKRIRRHLDKWDVDRIFLPQQHACMSLLTLYICVHVFLYVYIYEYLYIQYTHTCIHMCAHCICRMILSPRHVAFLWTPPAMLQGLPAGIYIHVYMCICMYICMCICIYVYMCVYVCMYSICVCMFIFVCIYVYV